MPEEDKYLTTRTELVNRLCILLGGRAAEKLVFNETTSGAADDIAKVTAYAHRMVSEFGMSEVIGPMALDKQEGEVFLGRDIARQRQYSEETARLIDVEVKKLVDECYGRVQELLAANRGTLDALAKWLIDREVLESDEITAIMENPAIVLPARETPPEQIAEPADAQADREISCEDSAAEDNAEEADDTDTGDESTDDEAVPEATKAQAENTAVKAVKKD